MNSVKNIAPLKEKATQIRKLVVKSIGRAAGLIRRSLLRGFGSRFVLRRDEYQAGGARLAGQGSLCHVQGARLPYSLCCAGLKGIFPCGGDGSPEGFWLDPPGTSLLQDHTGRRRLHLLFGTGSFRRQRNRAWWNDGRETYHVYCLLGDGEIEEGQIWEAAISASHYKLDHVIGFIDYNHLQIDGTIEEVIGNVKIEEKFKAFGWTS